MEAFTGGMTQGGVEKPGKYHYQLVCAGFEILCEFEAAARGWGALTVVVVRAWKALLTQSGGCYR